MERERIGKQVYFAGNFYKIECVVAPEQTNDWCDHYLIEGENGGRLEVRESECLFIKNKNLFHKITPLGTESAEIGKYLYANEVSVDSVLHGGFEEDDSLEIRIERGDWKHSHALCDYLMSVIGWIKVDETIDKDTGEDNYSSTHFYKRNQN